MVRTRQQCLVRRACGLQRTGAGVRAAVRARRARLPPLLCRSQAPGRAAIRRTPCRVALLKHSERVAAMPDIKIHRDHQLGLAKARKVALQWAEDAEKKFDM